MRSRGEGRRRSSKYSRLPLPIIVTLVAVALDIIGKYQCHAFQLRQLWEGKKESYSGDGEGERVGDDDSADDYNDGDDYSGDKGTATYTEEIGLRDVSPRRNVLEEWGEKEYNRRLSDAFGMDKLPEFGVEYGVDVSFPIHHARVSTNYAWLDHTLDPKDMPIQPLGDRQSVYEESIEGCVEYYGEDGPLCLQSEIERLQMNLHQPSSMRNFTDFGFRRIRAPKEMMDMLTKFWELNKGEESAEEWGQGDTYTNHWTSPPYVVDLENPDLEGGGPELKSRIWEAARSTIQEWTGQHLTPCSLYGIRVYKEGSILASHVDRMPLVSSAIINVAQDVDEDWPIEVYAHDGKAYNITMQPGDMVLYESHSVIHGRPFPLKGRYYANVFIHFEPMGSVSDQPNILGEDSEEVYRRRMEENEDTLPSYVIPGSAAAAVWRQEFNSLEKMEENDGITVSAAHLAAMSGDLVRIQQIAEEDYDMLHEKDENGWQPIHEGARSGHLHIVKLLVNHGADINERTNAGGTPLYIAKQENEEDTINVIEYLENIGALEMGPDL